MKRLLYWPGICSAPAEAPFCSARASYIRICFFHVSDVLRSAAEEAAFTMPKHPKRRTRRNLAVLALSALCLAGFLYWDNTALQVTRFDPVFSDLPAGFDGCRIVVLSDLHGASFGAHNADLLAAVAAEQPEYIFFLGDLEDKYRGPEDGYPAETARGLSAIAPTYYVTGNHEWASGRMPEMRQLLEETGVTYLSNTFVPLERNGDTITLAGIDDPNGYADQKTPEELAAGAENLEKLADELSAYDIVLATEVGGGVVPMAPAERAGREAAGRLACLLAARADCVVQMFCGIPTVLKGELPTC